MSPLLLRLSAPNGLKYSQPVGLFISNEFVASKSGEKLASVNPTTEETIACVNAACGDDVDVAVQAARKALSDPSWKFLSSTDRGNLIMKLANLVDQHKKTLATIESWDTGKPYQAALNDDINEVINTFRYYGSWADKISGQTINTHSPKDKLVYTICQPMGVVAQIIPWNFPLAMAAMKLGPALACGNTVILKPSEQSPLSILYLATLIQEAGFPPGVVNILNGLGRVAGACLAGHPGVDMVAFTGSTGTGKEIMRMAAGTLKEIILETGGKSPLVVFEDADLEQAVKWACFGCMYNQGQICTATSRLLVHETVIQKFLVLFKEQVDSIQVGDPFDKNTFQGPLISKSQLERVRAYIDAGKSEGANIVAGGKLIPGRGFYVTPTIFADVTEDMRIWQEEIFGPVAAVKTFSTEEEAVASANNTSYGLGAAVFTSDIQRAHRVAANIDAGTVWINSSNDSDIRVPFGGVKQSGIGRELGEAGLQAYLQVKAVHVNLGCSL